MPDNRKSNVSTSWGDSGWLQDGAAVFQKEEPEPETTTTETDFASRSLLGLFWQKENREILIDILFLNIKIRIS